MIEEKRAKVPGSGRKKGSTNKSKLPILRKKMADKTLNYFESKDFATDMAELSPLERLKINLSMLGYVLPKAESIKNLLTGLSDEQLQQLANQIKAMEE